MQVDPAGRVKFLCPRMEMGQGASLGLSQIIAEELNVDMSVVDCVVPNTNQLPPFKMTVGSEGIALFAEPVSLAAAALLAQLKRKAARKLRLPEHSLEESKGGFSAGGKFVAYKDLIQGHPEFVRAVPNVDIPRKLTSPTHQNRVIGQSKRHPDLTAIVTGEMVYSRDKSLPGMLHGGFVRPPSFGATLKNSNIESVKSMPGVVDVFEAQNFNAIAIVATTQQTLDQEKGNIQSQWRSAELNLEPIDVNLARRQEDFEHVAEEHGDISDREAQAVLKKSAVYETSYLAHAPMEARAAVVWARGERVDVWCGCQDPYFVRDRICQLLDRDENEVVVHPLRMGGGFGGRVLAQPAEEAALLSQRTGRPVTVRWTREEELQYNYFQPKFSHAIDAGLDNKGRISFWRHDFVSSPIIFGMVPKPISLILDAFIADKGTARGAVSAYEFASSRVRYSDIRSDIPTGAWRGLGSAPNTFAIESMMDELAQAAGKDPLSFRLAHVGQSNLRLKSVLKRVAQKSGWGASAKPNHGRGLACSVYKNQTYVAIVAEIMIDHEQQKIRVKKIWCAQDSGLVINPDQVKNLVLGNVVWGCSMALMEKITFNEGAVEQRNFHNYFVMRHKESPGVEIELVNFDRNAPVAVGESALAPVTAAIANAVQNASNQRPRQLPIAYETLFSAEAKDH